VLNSLFFSVLCRRTLIFVDISFPIPDRYGDDYPRLQATILKPSKDEGRIVLCGRLVEYEVGILPQRGFRPNSIQENIGLLRIPSDRKKIPWWKKLVEDLLFIRNPTVEIYQHKV